MSVSFICSAPSLGCVCTHACFRAALPAQVFKHMHLGGGGGGGGGCVCTHTHTHSSNSLLDQQGLVDQSLSVLQHRCIDCVSVNFDKLSKGS